MRDKPQSIDPNVVLASRPWWMRNSANLILNTLIEMFPEYPANDLYYTLRKKGSGVTVLFRLSIDTTLSVALTEDRDGNPLALGMISSSDIIPNVSRDNSVRSYQRMALNASCETDLLGWLFAAKTFYDGMLCRPYRYKALQDFTVTDIETGKTVEILQHTMFEVHPTFRGIRHKRDRHHDKSLSHPSWTKIGPGAIDVGLISLVRPKARINRFRIVNRIAFFCQIRNEGVNFKKGALVDVTTDHQYIRVAYPGATTDICDPAWVHVDRPDEIGRAIRNNELVPTTEDP